MDSRVKFRNHTPYLSEQLGKSRIIGRENMEKVRGSRRHNVNLVYRSIPVMGGPGSVVGIATGYGLEGPGDRIDVG